MAMPAVSELISSSISAESVAERLLDGLGAFPGNSNVCAFVLVLFLGSFFTSLDIFSLSESSHLWSLFSRGIKAQNVKGC